jgi:hypothetical protein
MSRSRASDEDAKTAVKVGECSRAQADPGLQSFAMQSAANYLPSYSPQKPSASARR